MLVKARNFAGAWEKYRIAIERHPNLAALRLAAAKLALDHGTYAWLGMAINDATVALQRARPRGKAEAAALKLKLEEKRSKADLAGGTPKEIQNAIDRGDWDAANRLLDQVEPGERTEFTRAIEQGRKWQAAIERGQKAEDQKQWPEAWTAYREAFALKSDAATEQAMRRAEGEVRTLYASECNAAVEKARAGQLDDARRHLSSAEQLMPAGLLHGKIKDEIQFHQHLADARRFQRDGKNAEALAAATKALSLKGDSAEAKSLVEQLKKEGPLALAKAALQTGDRAAAARHARAAAALSPGAAELKTLESELWADLYVEKAVASARGPVDDLWLASDGRIVGAGGGFGAFAVWNAATLKLAAPASSGGSRPLHAALIDKDGLRIAGLALPPGPDGPETQPVFLWENGRARPLEIEMSGMKLPLAATRLASFDGSLLLRIRWTPSTTRWK